MNYTTVDGTVAVVAMVMLARREASLFSQLLDHHGYMVSSRGLCTNFHLFRINMEITELQSPIIFLLFLFGIE